METALYIIGDGVDESDGADGSGVGLVGGWGCGVGCGLG